MPAGSSTLTDLRPGPVRSGPAHSSPVPAAAVQHRWEPRLIHRRGVRLHHLLLAAWTLIWLAVELPGGGYSWHYFVLGAHALVGRGVPAGHGGLHLYAHYPQLQIGPLALLAAVPFVFSGLGNGHLPAEVAMTLLGFVLVLVVERLARSWLPAARFRSARVALLLGAGAFLPIWTELSAHFGHLDDALALTLAVLALGPALAGQGITAGVLLGLSVDAKPWALVFLPLLLVLAGPQRRRAVIAAVAAIGIAWLPFVLADPATLHAAHFTIVNEPASALRALGVHSARTPSWDRLAQGGLGLAAGWVAVRRRRWAAVLLVGLDLRLMLDPAVYDYYTAGIVLAALIWDVLGRSRPLPLTTFALASTLWASKIVHFGPLVQGELRLGVLLAVLAAVLVPPPAGPASSPRSERDLREAQQTVSAG